MNPILKEIITEKSLKATMVALGYKVFEGVNNINIVGVRSKDNESNSFNDAICIFGNITSHDSLNVFQATTDPGLYWRQNLANIDGTAIVVPGQHRGVWTIGKHQGKYKAMVQNREIAVYRDNNLDNVLDTDVEIQEGFFGINCHRANANRESTQVDKWSAGCQVISDPKEFDTFMEIVSLSAEQWGNSFTYTLLTEDQILQNI